MIFVVTERGKKVMRMKRYDSIHSLSLEELAGLLATITINTATETAKKLGFEIEVLEEEKTEILKNFKAFLEGEVVTND